MVTPYDPEFATTKALKQGAAVLGAPFTTLADWIAATWRVAVLNVVYDRQAAGGRPRLQVIVEHEHELGVFKDGWNFDERNQQAVASQFQALVTDGGHRYQTRGLFVAFSAFAPIAREEAHARVSAPDLQHLQARLNDPALWTIRREARQAVFMFFTREDARRREAEGARQTYAAQYFDLLRAHDEFGYCEFSLDLIEFDSKERFDREFESNWFHYDRR